MSFTLQTLWHKVFVLFAFVLAVVFISSAFMAGKASASALTLTAATTTSSNTSSTTLAKVGNTVSYGIQLSGTPWETPKINIFGMGTTSFTSGAGAFWQYSTTSASSWTEGAITFLFSYGGTSAADATSTKSQADLTSANVVFDKTAPTGYTVSLDDSLIGDAESTATSFTFAAAQVGATYLFEVGSGAASTTGSGTIVTATDQVSSIDVSSLADGTITLNAALTDPAGNKGATTSATTVLDATAPSDPTADPTAGSYSGNQSVTLASSGSDSILYNIGAADVSNPSCSSGTTYSGAISVISSKTIRAIGCDTAGNSSGVATFAYTIHHSSGAGGGGGGTSFHPTVSSPPTSGLGESQIQSILSLLASFGADQSVINNVNASLRGQAGAGTSGAASGAFTRDLDVGSTGDDVKALQVFLNTHGYPLASSGPGSSGNETSTFGGLTQAALAKFQAAKGISPTMGYFGPKTRAAISGM